jgi:hypothetical protein
VNGRAAAHRVVAGDILLAPPVLIALAVLVVNDQLLKATVPGPLTGILSGIAGLVLTPAVLVGAVEPVRGVAPAASRRWRSRARS